MLMQIRCLYFVIATATLFPKNLDSDILSRATDNHTNATAPRSSDILLGSSKRT